MKKLDMKKRRGLSETLTDVGGGCGGGSDGHACISVYRREDRREGGRGFKGGKGTKGVQGSSPSKYLASF